MLRTYNTATGVLFALVLAVLTITPRLIRTENSAMADVAVNISYLWCCLFSCWILHHAMLVHPLYASVLSTPTRKRAASVFCGMLVVVVLTYAYQLSNAPVLFVSLQGLSANKTAMIYVFRAMVISGATYFAVYYLRVFLLWQQSRRENAYLQQEQLSTAMASLRQQISPHFLFNSLNTLVALSTESPVKEFTTRLSELYRYVLLHQEQNEIAVRDEIAFVESYVYILKSRFEDGLHVHIDVHEHVLDKKIVPLALQILIENAIKHNSTSPSQPLSVYIVDRGNALVVSNKLQPRVAANPSAGIGLHNLEQRYRLTANKDISIVHDATTFSVAIPLLP